jgi:hypothetical protein
MLLPDNKTEGAMTFDFIDRKFAQKPKVDRQMASDRLWWCDACAIHLGPPDVIGLEFPEIPRHRSCGCELDDWCRDCDNGGWVQVYSPLPPAFGECEKCYNPRGYSSP